MCTFYSIVSVSLQFIKILVASNIKSNILLQFDIQKMLN